jgi:2-succinyl-6-hydroxy-2,4-cyclohexadiene-1-carboxylate synthase
VATGPNAFRQTVDGLASRMTELGFDRFHLLGYSMGGRLALGLVCEHPERVGKAVVVGGAPGLADEAARTERLARDHETADKLETSDLAGFLHDWYAQPLFRDLARHENFPGILERRLGGRRRALAAALRSLSPGSQPPLHRCLSQAQVPLLLVAGAEDERYVASNRALAGMCPDARTAVIPNAGHSAHLERPAELARIVAQFLVEREGTQDG